MDYELERSFGEHSSLESREFYGYERQKSGSSSFCGLTELPFFQRKRRDTEHDLAYQNLSCNIVMLGDSKVGKTKFCELYTLSNKPAHQTTAFDIYQLEVDIMTNEKDSDRAIETIQISLHDTMGHASTAQARTILFHKNKVDIVLLCVNPFSECSIKKAKTYWLKELYDKQVPIHRIILIGLYDIKPATSGPAEPVTAKRLALEKDIDYHEFSFYDREAITRCMNEAITKSLELKS